VNVQRCHRELLLASGQEAHGSDSQQARYVNTTRFLKTRTMATATATVTKAAIEAAIIERGLRTDGEVYERASDVGGGGVEDEEVLSYFVMIVQGADAEKGEVAVGRQEGDGRLFPAEGRQVRARRGRRCAGARRDGRPRGRRRHRRWCRRN